MYDSVTAADIPAGALMVAGYVDGAYRWSDADWARFRHGVAVRIAVSPLTLDADVLDVETGDATIQQATEWVHAKRVRGEIPTVYIERSRVTEAEAAFKAAGMNPPQWWIAEWNGIQHQVGGAVATQYANPTYTGHHYDLSEVGDYWPGVDPPPIPAPSPAPTPAPTPTPTPGPAPAPVPPLDQARAAWARLGELLITDFPGTVTAIEAAVAKIQKLP